jgi:single-stranded-DNA-specific exonuclease
MASELDVERSICGRAWRARACDEAAVLAISQRLELPEIIARILAGRGLTPETAPGFLAPRVRAALPDPSHLLDLEVAVDRLCEAVLAGETVGLLGDYDVDGATSVALLARYLREVGTEVAIDVPDRLAEGYGPNPAAFERLAARGCRLVVTLDSGTTAFAALAGARERGLEVIVVDHHAAEPELPPALAVVNPNRVDQTSPLGDLAAVGVTFLLAVGLNRCLRARGHFAHRPEPDVRRWLDLVALGTVCDVVPLRGLNRAFAAQGLRVAARGANPGLVALAGMAKLEGAPCADHLGFWLGPRINAGGRVGRSALGAALLASDAPDEVAGIALELDRLNGERRTLERRVLDEAEAGIASGGAGALPLLLCAGEGWSPGVVGLVASRLVERYHRPAVVIGLADGIGKGSGRSVPGFDLGAAVIAARRDGLLLQGGGHAMAAGLTVSGGGLDALGAFLTERLRHELGPGPAGAPALTFDGSLRVGAISAGLAAGITRLAPFGRGNPEPRFVVPHARVWQARRVGESHVDCRLADPAGGRVRAIAFRVADGPLGAALLEAKGAPLHLAGRIRLDRWQGETRVCLQIDDAVAA